MLLNLILSCSARLLEIRANDQSFLDIIGDKQDANKIVDSLVGDGKYIVSAGNLSFESTKKEAAGMLLKLAQTIGDVPDQMPEIISHLKSVKSEPFDDIKSGSRDFAIIFTNDGDLVTNLRGIEEEGPVKFFFVTDEKEALKYETPFPGVLAFNSKDKNFLKLPLTNNLASLVSSIVLPSLVKITQETFKYLQSLEQKMYYVIENPSKFEEFKENFGEMTKASSSLAKFIFFAPEDVPTLINLLKTNETEYPLLVLLNKDSKGIVRNVTTENFLEGVNKLNTNTAEKLVFNSIIPEDNDSRPVKIVSTDSFNDFTENSKTDVLIAFTSPRCGHCKALEPVLDEVSKLMIKNNVPVVFGNYNVNENEEQPNFEASSVPTLFFKKAGSSDFIRVPGNVRALPEFLSFFAKEGGSSQIKIEDYSEYMKKENEIPTEDVSDSLNMEALEEQAVEEEKKERSVL